MCNIIECRHSNERSILDSRAHNPADMRWQTKCLIDNCKGLVPFQDTVRKLKRRLVPYQPPLGRGAYAIGEGLTQILWLRESIGTLEGRAILEIGSGWEPLIPMLFSLCRVARVYLTDLNYLLNKVTLIGSLNSLRLDERRILDTLGIESQEFERVVGGDIETEEEFLKRHGFIYLAPCDCRRLSLKESTLDVITSRSVLEHIPPLIIEEIFTECYRLLKPGGLACHFVDNSDHWEHGDKSISRVNFLRFGDLTFRLTHLNSLNYQNRLRHIEYVEMLRKSGFEILRAERIVDPRAVEALATFPLAPRFRRFSTEELATTDSYLLARKPL